MNPNTNSKILATFRQTSPDAVMPTLGLFHLYLDINVNKHTHVAVSHQSQTASLTGMWPVNFALSTISTPMVSEDQQIKNNIYFFIHRT